MERSKESFLRRLFSQRRRANTLTPNPSSLQSCTPKVLPTMFKWQGGGKSVAMAGSFNDWKAKIPMVKSKQDFFTIVELPEGEHEYKFYVDGQWVLSPSEPSIRNGVGTMNNTVKVRKSDFDLFQSLALDSQEIRRSKPDEGKNGYGQDIPVKKEAKQRGPPLLPQQLLQVILNKETSAHIEPNLLPEPDHVVVNHLYALSIKDGVMVLSGTHRFRRKFVTTLLYRPI